MNDKAKVEEILSKHTGEEGIYLTHGMIRGSDAIDAMLEFASLNQEEGWVSVEKQGPEPGIGILLYCKSGFITCGYKKKDKEYGFTIWQLFGDTELIIKPDDRITHWMPLPKPPKQ